MGATSIANSFAKLRIIYSPHACGDLSFLILPTPGVPASTSFCFTAHRACPEERLRPLQEVNSKLEAANNDLTVRLEEANARASSEQGSSDSGDLKVYLYSCIGILCTAMPVQPVTLVSPDLAQMH